MEPQSTEIERSTPRPAERASPQVAAEERARIEPHDSAALAAIAASARRKAYFRIILPLFITSIIAYLDRMNLSYAKTAMSTDLEFTNEMFGFGAGIFFVGYVLFEIPGALIAEKYSPRYWLARIMISWGILTGLMPFVTTAWQFYVLRFLIGAAEASLFPVIFASVIPRWFGSADRARAISLMLTSLQVSGIIGAPLAGWLLGMRLFGLTGWQVLFFIEALPAVLFGFVLVRWMSDWPKDAAWLTPEEKRLLTRQYEQELAAKGAVQHYTVWQALHDVEVLRLCATYFLWMTGYWAFNYWMPTFLKEVSGWSDLVLGWAFTVPMCLSLVAMLWVGHHSSKTGEKRFHGAVGMFLAAAGMLCFTQAEGTIQVFACMCMAGVGVYAALGVWWSYPTTFLSGAAAAGAAGFINSVGSASGFLGPYLTGFVRDRTGGYTGAWLYMALSLTCAGCLMLTFKKKAPAVVDVARTSP